MTQEALEENIDPAMRRAGWCGLMHPAGHTCMKDVGHAPPHEDDMSGGIWEDEPYQDTEDAAPVDPQIAAAYDVPPSELDTIDPSALDLVTRAEAPGETAGGEGTLSTTVEIIYPEGDLPAAPEEVVPAPVPDPPADEAVLRELDARLGSSPDPVPVQTGVETAERAADGDADGKGVKEDVVEEMDAGELEHREAIGASYAEEEIRAQDAGAGVCPSCGATDCAHLVRVLADQPEPEQPESEAAHTAEVVRHIPVAQFEGEFARVMTGKLPAITLDMPEGFARGTHLKLEVEVRVRRISYDEVRSGEHKGELLREHVFALEQVQLLGAFHPDEVDPGVGGSLGQLES